LTCHGLGQVSDSDTPFIGDLSGNLGSDLGGDISDESRILDLPFAVEEPLVSFRFPLLIFLNNLIQLGFLQGLVAIDAFHRFFILEHFSSNSKGRQRNHGPIALHILEGVKRRE
jgi:hypothetical protein